MRSKLVLTISFVLSAVSACPTLAADLIWDNNSNDGLWRTAVNWSLDRVPDNTLPNVDKAKINSVPGPLIDAGTAAKAAYIACGDGGGLVGAIGELNMTGGTLDISSASDSWTILGYGLLDEGTFTIDGGTITTTNRVFVGFGGQGTLNMNGGTFNIGGAFGIGYGAGSGIVHLNGGTINVTGTAEFYINPNGLSGIDMAGGTFIMAGDRTEEINDYIDEGLITSAAGPDSISVIYNSGKTIARTYAASAKAQLPAPVPGATGITPYADLVWISGSGAVSHNVYFGTANPPSFKGNQTATAFDPCQLALNTTYYWRIDEVSGTGTVTTGDLWSFTTAPTFLTVGFSDNFDDGVINTSWTKYYNLPATIKEANGVLRISVNSIPIADKSAGIRFAASYPFQSFQASIDFRIPLGNPDLYFYTYSTTRYNQCGLCYALWSGWPGLYDCWWANEDDTYWMWRDGFGNENTAWHNLKIAYDAHTMEAALYVDNALVGSKTGVVDLSNFIIDIQMHIAPGMSAPLAVEFNNFTCVSQPGKIMPAPSFTCSPQVQAVNQSITFDASASQDPDGTITNYQWSFGDGNSASGQIVTHSYAHSGQYTVNLTVTDNDNLSGSAQHDVIIKTLAADNSDPVNGAAIVPCDKILEWTTGLGAASHNVYFGTDAAAVASAERAVGDLDASGQVDYQDLFILIDNWLSNPAGSVPYGGVNDDAVVDFNDYTLLAGNWMAAANSCYKGNTISAAYDPGKFATNTTYYWRVDEVNGPVVRRGDVWTFTTNVIDSDYSLAGKVMCGYQGWFNTPADDANRGWVHWGNGSFSPSGCNVDLWPDMTEYDPNEKYLAPEFFDGTDHYVFSSHNRNTVLRHFRWMQDYGIDGVYLQRFATECTPGSLEFNHRNDVLSYCKDGANMYGRKYAVMYDLSGLGSGGTQIVIDDWKFLVDTKKVGRDANDNGYMFHKGKPVVSVWGIGFNDGRLYSLQECLNLVNFLRNDPVYGGCTVMVGVPSYWRTLNGDCVGDATVHTIVRAADIVSPWAVGRYGDSAGVINYANAVWIPDIAWCSENNVEYLPVIFPGFSWHNMHNGSTPLNQIPRNGGQFLWDQVKAGIDAGSTMIYQAMFDEVDEGTAVFKITNNPPRPGGVDMFVTPSYDGTALPSDEYLWLVGQAGKALRGEIPATSTRPSRP
jgi:glycoprotein endo-alpha-1,2-mannosidase